MFVQVGKKVHFGFVRRVKLGLEFSFCSGKYRFLRRVKLCLEIFVQAEKVGLVCFLRRI
jgi:hypothetical protein